MDILRNLFGNLSSGLIRLAVTVGILAAVYLFIVRPVLDTTNNAIDSANKSFEQSFGNGQNSVNRQIQRSINQANRQVRRAVNRSLRQTRRSGGHNPEQLLRCVQRANQNVQKLQACSRKY
jgi:predicted PurR-regulated permease PerM